VWKSTGKSWFRRAGQREAPGKDKTNVGSFGQDQPVGKKESKVTYRRKKDHVRGTGCVKPPGENSEYRGCDCGKRQRHGQLWSRLNKRCDSEGSRRKRRGAACEMKQSQELDLFCCSSPKLSIFFCWESTEQGLKSKSTVEATAQEEKGRGGSL